MFCTGKNTGRIGHVPAVPVNFEQFRAYRPVPGVLAGTGKNVIIIIIIIIIIIL